MPRQLFAGIGIVAVLPGRLRGTARARTFTGVSSAAKAPSAASAASIAESNPAS